MYVTSWNKKNKFLSIWESATTNLVSLHPYIMRKKIKPYGVRVLNDELVIPVYDNESNIKGIQTIKNDGTKKFAFESQIEANFFALNPETKNDKVAYIAEGFATSSSIAEAKDCVVFCAFSAGNMAKVALAVRKKFTGVIVIAGDNKSASEVELAHKAALACNGFVALPSEGCDFNDDFINGIDIAKSLDDYQKPIAPKEKPQKVIVDYSNYDEDFDEETIKDMLSYVSPDIGYHEWIEIGMSLKSSGASLRVWDDWSSKGASYKKNDCASHWGSFKGSGITIGTLVHHAKLSGWERKYEHVVSEKKASIDLVSIIGGFNKKKIKKDQPIEFDGLIGDTVKWIVSTGTYKQPMLATLNVLAALGAVFGRKYASRINTRTNLYVVGVGASGCGKDHSRRCIANLMTESGLSAFLGDNGVRSDSGIVKSLSAQASQVMMIDEFGIFLKALKDQKSAGHIKAVSSLMLQLYSCSSSVYKHGTYATDKMESMILHYPNLCIYGTTTEEMYINSISKEGIKSGELNRFVVLFGDDDAEPCHNPEQSEIPTLLIEAWKALGGNPTGDNLGNTNSAKVAVKPFIVGWGECWDDVCALLDYQHSKRSEENSALWVRYRENIIKIAMIYALSEYKFELEKKHIETAKYYVEASIKYMDKLAKTHMAENQWEELYNEFIHLLEKNNREMRKTDLLRAMKKVKRKDIGEMLEGMKDSGTIAIEGRVSNGNAGRPTVYVKLL